MKRIFGLVCVLALTLCLCGCGSSTSLDRQVTIGTVTLNVPSSWVEEKNQDGFAIFKTKDSSASIGIVYSNLPSSRTPEERIETIKETYLYPEKTYSGSPSDIKWKASDFTSNRVDERVIDGATCTVYEYSYNITNEKGTEHRQSKVAYLDRPDMSCDITVNGDLSIFNSMLNSIAIS